MLLFLMLWALVPCLVLLTLYFLSSTGGKSGGNKKNDGVKVSPREPAGLSLPETCGQALGKLLASLTAAAGDLSDPGPSCSPQITQFALLWRPPLTVFPGSRLGNGRWPGLPGAQSRGRC